MSRILHGAIMTRLMKKSSELNNMIRAFKDGIYLKSLITTILVVCFLMLPKCGFHTEGASGFQIINNLLFPLSHANVFHLLCNVYCIWQIRNLKRYVAPAFIISFLCSLLPEYLHNIMGCSGVIFSIVGLKYGEAYRFKDMVKANWWFFAITAFIPNVAVLFHLYCIIISFIIGNTFNFVVLWKKKSWL